MSVFTIGDLHLSLASDKPMDKFRGWENYVERLRENWSASVTPDDTVILPGDLSWAMSLDESKTDLAFLNELNGTKILLKGNHDYWWNTVSKMNAFFSANGFDSLRLLFNCAYAVEGKAVAGTRGWFFDDNSPDAELVILREAGRLRRSLEEAQTLADETIAFLHYPPVSQGRTCREIVDVLSEFGIKRCYFGHLHGFVSPENADFTAGGIHYTLVSADHLAFRPLPLYSRESTENVT